MTPIHIDTGPLPVLGDSIAPDRLMSGTPATGTRSAYENEAAGFYTGIWESSPGAWRVVYEEDEMCTMLAGHARLSWEGGSAEYRAGDSFVIPRGFIGVWETLEHCRKVYAIAL